MISKLKTIPEQTKEKESAQKDFNYVMNYFKGALEKLEKINKDQLE